uniref:Uncharacterized protein n=1 Tax=Guillardia theta TaxID=55529 RepID=A0A6U5X546_GUITH
MDSEILGMSARVGRAICLRLKGKTNEQKNELTQIIARNTQLFDPSYLTLMFQMFDNNLDAAKDLLNNLHKLTDGKTYCYHYTLKPILLEHDLRDDSEIVKLKDDSMYMDRILDLVYNQSVQADNAELIWIAVLDLIVEGQFAGALNILEHMMHCESTANTSIQHVEFHFDKYQEYCKSMDNQVLKISPTNDYLDNELRAIFHLRRGRWLEKNLKMTFEAFGEYSMALELLNLSTRKNSINVKRKAFFKRFRLFLHKGNYSDAMMDLKSCIDFANILVQTTSSRNDYAKASLNRSLQKYHFNLGFVSFCVGQHEQAEMSFTISLGHDDFVSRSHAYLGLIYSKQPSKAAEAIKSLKQSLKGADELKENEREVRLALAGLLMQHTVEYKGAIQQYSQVVKSHPTDLLTRSLRANLYFLQGMFQEALEDYSHCLKLPGEGTGNNSLDLSSLRYFRGCCYQKLEKFSEAKKDFEMIHSEKKNDSDFLQSLAAVYEACGQIESSIETYSSLVEILGKRDKTEEYIRILRHRAKLCTICDQETWAIKDLSKIIAMRPKDAEAHYERGSLIKVTHLDAPTASDEPHHVQLRMAIDDFACIESGHPLYVKARIKLKAVCNALGIPTEEEFKEQLIKIEKNRIDGIDPDYVMEYVLKMSQEIQQDAASGLRKFNVRWNKSVVNHETKNENARQVDIIASLDGTYCISEHRRIIYGGIKSKYCVFERELSQQDHYPFKMRFKVSGDSHEVHFICQDQESRDTIFRTHHRLSYTSDTGSMYRTPIHLMKELSLKHSKDEKLQYHLARLQEEDGDFESSIRSYLNSLRLVSPSSLLKDSYSDEFQRYHHTLLQYIPELSLAMLLPWNGNSSANRMKSKVFYRLGSIEIKRSALSDSPSTLNEFSKNVLEVSMLLDRNLLQPNILLGKHFMQEKKFETAIQYFQNVIRINKDMPEAYNNLGVALDCVGRESEALEAFGKALRDKSNLYVAECNIIMIKLRQVISRQEASSVNNRLDQLINTKSLSNSFIFTLRGLSKRKLITLLQDDAEAKTKLTSEMRKDFKTALKLDPMKQQARMGLILSYLEEFEVQSAIELLGSFQDPSGQPGSRKELIVTALKLKSYFVKPVATFLHVLRMTPDIEETTLLHPSAEFEEFRIIDQYLLRYLQNSAFSVQMTHHSLQKFKKQIQIIVYGFEQDLCAKVIKSLDKILMMSECNDYLKILCLMKRTLAHERVGNLRQAATDALMALEMLGLNLSKQQDKHHSFPTCQGDLSTSLLYAFLCYTGNLHESDKIRNYKLAKHIYRTATIIEPDKVLGYLNLGNLYRKRLKFLHCMQSYLDAMRCNAANGRKTNSEFAVHLEQTYELCTKYFESMVAKMKGNAAEQVIELSSLEGDLLLIEQRINRIQAPSRSVRMSLKRASHVLLQNGDSVLKELHTKGATCREITEKSFLFEDFYAAFNSFSDVLESIVSGKGSD